MHIARAFTQSIRYCLLKEHLLRVCDNAYTESIYSELVLNAYTESSYSEIMIMHISRAVTQRM